MKDRIRSCMQQLSKAAEKGLINPYRLRMYDKFLKDISKRINFRNLTDPQERYLKRIEESCSEEKIEEHTTWTKHYDANLREVAIICAEYYARTGDYYLYTSNKVLNDREGHILTKEEFKKMCANKYSHAVINAWTSKPAYHVGQLVQIRKTNRLDMYRDRWNNVISSQYKLHKKAMDGASVTAVVLESNAAPIYRPIKGGKVYKILPFGSTTPVYACEKDIKKLRKGA